MISRKKVWLWSLVAGLALMAAVWFAMGVGAASIGWRRIAFGLVSEMLGRGQFLHPTERMILLEIRLPRILLTGLVGMSLAVSGAVLQALLRNPLAEPFILGISSGAAVGALLYAAAGAGAFYLFSPIAAFAGAMFTVVLVFSVAGSRGRLHTTTILLTGVIVNAFFTSIIMLLLATSSESKLQHMLFWLYGDLTSARYREVFLVAPLAAATLAVMLAHARGLNILATGEDTAKYLGVSVERDKWLLFCVTSILTGAAVSVSGIIGFVGLIVPHLVRMGFGPDHRLLIPLSALWGGVFLILADAVARVALAPNEVPVGVVTAALGAPFFILLLRQRGTGWNLS